MNDQYDIDYWHRYGRGRSFSFFITDSEMKDILLSSLLPQYEPYSLIYIHQKKIGNIFKQFYEEKTIDKFLECREGNIVNYYIRSQLLTDIQCLSNIDRKFIYLSTNGLLILHHGFIDHTNGWMESTISIVNKIINNNTNELIIHTEYEKIFNKLIRNIKKKLCYKSKWENGDGIIVDQKILMSEEFVTKCKSGEIKTKTIIGEHI